MILKCCNLPFTLSPDLLYSPIRLLYSPHSSPPRSLHNPTSFSQYFHHIPSKVLLHNLHSPTLFSQYSHPFPLYSHLIISILPPHSIYTFTSFPPYSCLILILSIFPPHSYCTFFTPISFASYYHPFSSILPLISSILPFRFLCTSPSFPTFSPYSL